MDVVGYLWHVGGAVAFGAGLVRVRPDLLEPLVRQTGLDRRRGWTLYVAAVLWLFLPVLAGSREGELWFLGTGVMAIGCLLLVFAVGAVDEYRLLARVDHVDPRRVTPGGTIATSGRPAVADPGADRTPLSGLPSVHSDWAVERHRGVGNRTEWTEVVGGVATTEFTLGDGAVAVTAGRHRVFTDAEQVSKYDPDEPLPAPAADVFREHTRLPAPDEREETFRLREWYLPADEPVTVVGVPRQAPEPGRLVIDTAPPDHLFGTHTDHSTPEDTEPEAVLVQGDAVEAKRRLRRTVFGAGGAGLAMVFGGQWLAFRLSSASLEAVTSLGP